MVESSTGSAYVTFDDDHTKTSYSCSTGESCTEKYRTLEPTTSLYDPFSVSSDPSTFAGHTALLTSMESRCLSVDAMAQFMENLLARFQAVNMHWIEPFTLVKLLLKDRWPAFGPISREQRRFFSLELICFYLIHCRAWGLSPSQNDLCRRYHHPTVVRKTFFTNDLMPFWNETRATFLTCPLEIIPNLPTFAWDWDFLKLILVVPVEL